MFNPECDVGSRMVKVACDVLYIVGESKWDVLSWVADGGRNGKWFY